MYNILVNDLPALQKITANFLQELTDAAVGKETSLPFITHQLSPTPLVHEDEVFQVLVIGGSMCKSALVQKKGDAIEIKKISEKQQPPFITRFDTLSFIENELDKNVRILTLNFAYPLTPVFENNKLDGILLAGSKENTFSGLIGKKICEEIEAYIKEKRGQTIKASAANDTICLLLSGLTEYPAMSLAGGIVGTGVNFALFLDDKTAVNLEAANFDKFVQSEEGKEIDASSAYQGRALLEKETSGAYLHKHFNSILKKKNIRYHEITSTWELKKLAFKNIPGASPLANELLSYSANLVACAIAGITLFKKTDLTFVMDGSFFWGEDIYKDAVVNAVKKLVPQHSVSFANIHDNTILGAAKLVA